MILKVVLADHFKVIPYLLTPWSRVLLEKLTGSQLVKKFPALYGSRKFITAFTSAQHLSLSWAKSIHSMPPHPTSWRSILILFSDLRQFRSTTLRIYLKNNSVYQKTKPRIEGVKWDAWSDNDMRRRRNKLAAKTRKRNNVDRYREVQIETHYPGRESKSADVNYWRMRTENGVYCWLCHSHSPNTSQCWEMVQLKYIHEILLNNITITNLHLYIFRRRSTHTIDFSTVRCCGWGEGSSE